MTASQLRHTSRVALAVALVLGVSDLALAQSRIAAYREPPYGACRFVQEQFHATPDPWQEQLLVATVDPTIKRISLQACAGPGKTCGMAWVGWYFLATQASPGWHPKGLATSITDVNLKDNLWTELAHWQGRSEFLSTAFTWSSSRVSAKDHPETWFLAARNWPKSGSADEQGRTFSGLHGQNILILVDESGAIPPTVLRAAEQALPNTRFGLILQGGNPISLEGMLYEAANRLRHQWHIIVVTGDPDQADAWVNSPRVAGTHTGQPDCACPACWARQQIQTYGRDNPWVMSYILGKFPPRSINSLLSIDDVTAAQTRHLPLDAYNTQQKRLGVDVARFGDDRTVIFARQGLNARCARNNPVVMRSANTNEIVARVVSAKLKWGSQLELIDNSFQWGNGVVDNLMTAGYTPHAVDFGGKAYNNRFENRRAEGWMLMAEAIKDRGAALPNLAELVAELTTPTYTFSNNGRFMLESKELVKKRLGRSPDLGDALALTYMYPELPDDVIAAAIGQQQGKVNTAYDPFASFGQP